MLRWPRTLGKARFGLAGRVMWFSTLVRGLLRRGGFRSPKGLQAQILTFVETYDRLRAHPVQVDLQTHSPPDGSRTSAGTH